MQLDWTTFLLEIANFLVLVWILQRFLYRPVRAAIDRRQEKIETLLGEARAAETKAEELKGRYENRLNEWGAEREKLRAQLGAELDAERTRRRESLEAELEQERERSRVLDAAREQETKRAIEERALDEAGRFAARLLERLATPALDERLFDLFLDDLRALSDDVRRSLQNGVGARAAKIVVTTAHPLSADRRATLAAAVHDLTGNQAPVEFAEDEGLLAGLCVALGPWVLRANLRDELAFFVEGTRGTGVA
jgi:F-type H+-transporting ATPase subunit b